MALGFELHVQVCYKTLNVLLGRSDMTFKAGTKENLVLNVLILYFYLWGATGLCEVGPSPPVFP